jgi:hypothetical protein
MQSSNNCFLSCDVINSLQDYVLSEENISKINETKLDSLAKNKKPEVIKIQPKSQNTNNCFFPRQKDSLFWCFYVMKNGVINYEMLGLITPIVEKKLKIEYVEKIRKQKPLLKSYRFASISNIENQLVNESNINVKTLLSLCVIENLNVVFINNKTYYELLMNDGPDIHTINNFDNNHFGCKTVTRDNSELDKLKSSLFKMDNIDKPIKSISSYKVSELLDFCTKLSIETSNKETGKTKSKKELYESFIQHF